MPATRKPRKAYRPRPVVIDALARLQPASHAQLNLVLTRFHTALDAMARGKQPGPEEWRDMADVTNTVEVLATTMGLLAADATMPAVERAKAAMVAAEQRWRTTGRAGLDGLGLQALRDVLAIYQQAATGFTQHAMNSARLHVERQMRAVLRDRSIPAGQVVAL